MRRWILMNLSLFLLVFQAFPVPVSIDDVYYNLNETDKTASVTCRYKYGDPTTDWMYFTSDSLYMGDVVIPSEVVLNGETYTVSEIGTNAFAGSKLMTSLSLPATVTTIGSGTFSLCNALSSIFVDMENPVYLSDNGIMYRKDPISIFFVPRALSGVVTLLDGLTEVSSSAFQSCTSVTSVTIPNSVTKICDGAFDKCTSLTEVVVGTGLEAIERNAFSNCSQLVVADFSATKLKSIGHSAFDGCSSLMYAMLGDFLETIGNYAFYGNALVGILLPATLKSIGTKAFYECESLSTVINYSDLNVQAGSEENGYVAYYATEVSGNELVEASEDPFVVNGKDGITLYNVKNRRIQVFDLHGRFLYNQICNEETLHLNSNGLNVRVKISERNY